MGIYQKKKKQASSHFHCVLSRNHEEKKDTGYPRRDEPFKGAGNNCIQCK